MALRDWLLHSPKVATPATHDTPETRTVATVASVAVAGVQKQFSDNPSILGFCLGHYCEHVCYDIKKGNPLLWCGKVEKAIFEMMVCPSGLWFKSPDNKRVFDTPEGQQQRFKGGMQ